MEAVCIRSHYMALICIVTVRVYMNWYYESKRTTEGKALDERDAIESRE